MEFSTYLDHVENDYSHFMDQFSSACKNSNGTLKTIGRVKKYDLYSCYLNPEAKRTLCFIGAVHGNEITGPYAMLKFLEKKVPRNVRILLYPVVNPVGFNEQTRTATDRLNLNRQFDKIKLKNEADLLKRSLLEEKIDFLHTFHEDSAQNAGFYVYYSNPENEQLCKQIVELTKKLIPTDTRKVIYGDKCKNGLIHVDIDDSKPQNKKALDTWMYKMGVDYICTETPSVEPLETRAACGEAIMRLLCKSI